MRNSKLSAVSGGFVPARLTIAREARGLKQKELADELNFVPATISKWESEGYGQAPDSNSLDALSAILQVDLGWFFKPLQSDFMSPPFYRSMRSELSAARDRAAAKLLFSYEIFDRLNEYVEFPNLDIPHILPAEDYRSLSAETIEKVASRLREYWGLGDDPISDLMVVLENAGIVVAETYLDSTKLDGVSAWFGDVPVVLLAKDKEGGVRRRFDAAHELGHLVLHHGLSKEAIRYDLRLIEEQAMLFAGAFLLPPSSFASTMGDASLDYLAAIKPRWGVSVGAMIKRLGSLHLISENHERNLWKYYSYRKWRGNEPHDDSIAIERPENLRSALEMLASDDPDAIRNVRANIALSGEYIGELTGVDHRALWEIINERPKLRLVRSPENVAAND